MCLNFSNLGFFMSGTMSDKVSAMSYYLCLYIIHAYMYELESSFTDISGSNGPILIKFAQLFQQVI